MRDVRAARELPLGRAHRRLHRESDAETFYLAARESFIEAALIEIVVKFKLVVKIVVEVNFVEKDSGSDFRTSQTNYGLQTDSNALNYSKALADIRQRTQVRVRFKIACS